VSLLREDSFEKASSIFYEAAVLPELWPQALDALAAATGSRGAGIVSWGRGIRVSPYSDSMTELAHRYVAEQWHPRNTRQQRGMALVRRNVTRPVSCAELLTPEEVARDPSYQELLIPCGGGAGMGAVVARDQGGALVLNLERPIAQGPFSRDELSRLGSLVDCLRSAGQLALRLGAVAVERGMAQIDAMDRAAMLVDGAGRVKHLNRPGEALRGEGLRLVAGRPSWREPAGHEQLSRLIAAALSRSFGHPVPESAVLPRSNGRKPVVARATPLIGAAQDVFHTACAIIIFDDLERPAPPAPDLLRRTFGLTAAEARLASHLAAGQDLETAAELCRITRETARGYLKSVFAKTGTRRQGELVALLARLPSRSQPAE